jgi:hypothetical protein
MSDEPRRRGRPSIGDRPLTSAEAKRRQRERLRGEGRKEYVVMPPAKVCEVIERYCEATGQTRQDLIESICEYALVEWAVQTESMIPTLADWHRRCKEAQARGEPRPPILPPENNDNGNQ